MLRKREEEVASSCHYCDYTTCKSCAKRFILDSVNPSCMNCKKPWNREMISEKFGKTFIYKEYKKKRERDLFETEKALMPETQELTTHEISELRVFTNESVTKISKMYNCVVPVFEKRETASTLWYIRTRKF
jgi:hypothetical protein